MGETFTSPCSSVWDAPLVSPYKFIGLVSSVNELNDIDANEGYVCVVGDSTYLYRNSWINLSCDSTVATTCSLGHSFRDIKVSTCPHCAAALPLTRIDNAGVCTCEYCGSPVYVY